MAFNFKDTLHAHLLRFDTSTLDGFRMHLTGSIKKTQNDALKEYQNLQSTYPDDPNLVFELQSNIEDALYETTCIEELAAELLIIALHKQTEIHITKVAKQTFPGLSQKHSRFVNLMVEVRKAGNFSEQNLKNFAAFEELRCISNAIKHESTVTAELAQKFPAWQEGVQLGDLNGPYERLRPLVEDYVCAFVDAAFQNSTRSFPKASF